MQTAKSHESFPGAVNNRPEGNGRKKDAFVVCRSRQGGELQASLLRSTRYTAAFQIFPTDLLIQSSEVLDLFKIVSEERTLYAGSAVIRSLVDFGPMMVCEAVLEEASWSDYTGTSPQLARARTREGFQTFLREWEETHNIVREFKEAVGDLESFLNALRLWLDQVESSIRNSPAASHAAIELETIEELIASAAPAVSAMFERFETAAAAVPAHLVPAHQAYCRRQLHPLLMCCPFMNRIFHKPLGYAGDYEMMNMIVRRRPEGDSLFARLLQSYILEQAPAAAVRNRVDYFVGKFLAETARVQALGRRANICSIGCGPAREVENFLREHPLANQAKFRLLDFNDETIGYTTNRLQAVQREHQRRTSIQLVKKPAQFLLKETGNSVLGDERYDLIYCSGLYDYLNDRVIKALNTRLFERLNPGGILIVTNFDPYNPIRHIMEFLFDWFLIHRDGKQLAALAPEQAEQSNSQVRAEFSGCNIFLEARKP